jgi:hypothetical protein
VQLGHANLSEGQRISPQAKLLIFSMITADRNGQSSITSTVKVGPHIISGDKWLINMD